MPFWLVLNVLTLAGLLCLAFALGYAVALERQADETQRDWRQQAWWDQEGTQDE